MIEADRFLLEHAAMAAGYNVFWSLRDMKYVIHAADKEQLSSICTDWNPLTNRSDSFTLMIKLGISVEVGTDEIQAYPAEYDSAHPLCASEPAGDDEDEACLAACRAIVRVAAMLGEHTK